MTKFISLAAGLSVALAACASSYPVSGSLPLDNRFNAGGISWRGSGETIIVYAAATELDSNLGICGLWTTEASRATTSKFNDEVIRAGFVTLAGKRVVQGLGFMPYLPEGTVEAGSRTTCVKTDMAWEEAYATADVQVGFPRMRFID
ncbi:MAG: hypothetical protein AAF713_22060 [Pseudomonadota bacterium]